MTRDEIERRYKAWLEKIHGNLPEAYLINFAIAIHDAAKEEDALKLKEMEADAAQAAVGGAESWTVKVDAYAYAAKTIRASKVVK